MDGYSADNYRECWLYQTYNVPCYQTAFCSHSNFGRRKEGRGRETFSSTVEVDIRLEDGIVSQTIDEALIKPDQSATHHTVTLSSLQGRVEQEPIFHYCPSLPVKPRRR